MRNIKKKTKIVIAGLLILFILMSYYVSTLQFNPPCKELSELDKEKEEIKEKVEDYHRLLTSAFASSDFSITQGMNLFENKEYLFSAQFWNDGALTETFTQGWLETKIVGDDTTFEDPLTMDLNYDQETVDTDNITFSNGSLGKDGDMTSQDANEAWFNSSEGYHYPATYSFTNDADGSNPAEWTVVETGGSVNVYPNLNNHRKVVELNDTSGSGVANTYNTFSSQTSGIVEFYALITVSNLYGYIQFKNTLNSVIYVYFRNTGYISVYNGGTTIVDLQTYSINTWYHFKISFNCTTQKFDVYINNILKASQYNFFSSQTSVNRISFSTGTAQSSYKLYIDAIGYSWDSNYAVGNNLFWQNYMGTNTFEQYNQSTNTNYFGEYDFEKYPINSVVGNYTGTYGFDYSTLAGYYYMGTDDFNDEPVNEIPANIDWITSWGAPINTEIKISAELNGHKNILNFTDNTATNYPLAYHYFDSLRTNVVVEFWYATNNTAEHSTHVQFMNSTASKIHLLFTSNGLKYYNRITGDFQNLKLGYIVPNVFSHYKLISNDSNNCFDLYINGTLEGDDLPSELLLTNGISKLLIRCESATKDTSFYFDAIGCPTDDPYYRESLNINPYDLRYILAGMDTIYGGTARVPHGELGIGCEFNIISSLDGHINVYRMVDNNNAKDPNWYAYHSATTRTSGTMEFWYRTTDNTKILSLQFIDPSWQTKFTIYLGSVSGKIQYGGTSTVDVCSINNNQWYHVRIDFSCTTDKTDVYVNGTKYIDQVNFQNVGDSVKFIRFYSSTLTTGATHYIDAIDFSWTSGYITYRSTNPYGQLTSLESDGWSITYAPFTSYSIVFENSAHNKILNATDSAINTINAQYLRYFDTPKSNGGITFWIKTNDVVKHITIQMSSKVYLGIDTNNFMYYDGSWHDIPSAPIPVANTWYHISITFDATTDKAQYWIDGWESALVNCVPFDTLTQIAFYTSGSTPEHRFYINALTYNWIVGYVSRQNTNPYYQDLVNTNFDDEWTITYMPFTTVYINGFYNNHKKHLNLTDSSAINKAGVYYTFPDTISGWVEMWVMSPPTGKNATINIEYGTGEYGAFIRFDIDNTIDVYDGGWVNLMSISPSTWYRIKIYFDCISDTYDLYVNEVLKRAGNDFLFGRDTLNKLMFRTSNTLSGYSFLVDSIGFSWEDTMGIIMNLTVVPTLNFTIDLEFDEILVDVIQLVIYRYQYTPTSTPITMYMYNFTTGLFHNVSRVVSTVGTLFTYTDSIFCMNVINSTNNMRIRIYAFNNDYEFYLRIDRFQVKFWEKTLFSVNKTFYEMNTWKYRFHVHSATLGDKYTDWVYFDVIARESNFKAVSESRYSTEWILNSIGQTVSSEIVYDEDFKSNTWTQITGTPTYFTLSNVYVEHDSWVWTNSPDDNNGGDVEIHAFEHASYTDTHWWGYIRAVNDTDSGYILYPTGLTLYYYITAVYNQEWGTPLYIYRAGIFDESTITWNNKPTTYNSIQTINPYIDTGWHSVYYATNSLEFSYRFTTADVDYDNDPHVIISSSEGTYRPYLNIDVTKFYQNKPSGYAWYQTSTSELIGMQSPVLSDRFLHAGSTILLDLETDQDDVQVRLLNNGIEVKSIQALQYNLIYTEQEVEVYVDEDITFDQVKIVSNLQDKQYVKLYNIRCTDIEYEDEELTTDLHIQAYGSEKVLLPDGITSLKIYENNILRINKTIILSFDLYTEVFEAPYFSTVYLGLYDYDNEFLSFERFTVYINYTYNNQDFTDIRLFSNQLFVDEGTIISFIIYDSFNVAVYNQSRIAQTFIDIYLQVYSLKIKNDDYRRVDFELQKLPITKTGILAPNELIEYSIYSGTYNFSYTKEGWGYYEDLVIDFSADNLLVINSSQLCYLSYANQKTEYLFFSNYKTYLNSTLIYFNTFYGEVSEHIGIEIKDRYGISILNQTYIVQSEENYIAITLTEYSLKVYNQQPYFNHINITRDPNYYETEAYWSEWMAPSEIVDFRLFGGYYRINFTRAETSDWYAYAYTLNGDDILVITSSNTIYNVLQNIQNVNTTIGNQITNVWIDITNQNSDINNTIINIDIALTNVNSTLGTMLLYQNISLTNIESNISSLFVYIGSEFTTLGSNINASFIDLESTVYLVNNTIYTAVNSLESNLLIINNSISGNITFMLAQNVFLTEMFQKTMFSHLLNWSNVAYNVSFLEEQIMLKKFINNYKDKTLELQLRYQNVTETLRITAQNAKEQYLPINNVSMRVYSVDDGIYLSEWEGLSAEDEEVIDFGFYEELEVPIGAEVVDARVVDYVLAFILLGVIIASLTGFVYYYYQRSEKQKRKVEIMNEYPNNNQFNQTIGFKKRSII